MLSNNVMAVLNCIDLNEVVMEGSIDTEFGWVRYRDGTFSVEKDTIFCNNTYTNNYSDITYINIGDNGITLDCNNSTFINNGTNVLGISNRMNNVVIKNCNLVGFTQGIKSTPDEGYLNFSEGVELFSNFIVDPTIEIDKFNTLVTGLSIVRNENYLFNFVGHKGGQHYLSIINYTDFSSMYEIDLSDFSYDGTSLFSLENECAVLVHDKERLTKINCLGETEWLISYGYTSFGKGSEDFKFTEDPNTNNIIVSSLTLNNVLEFDVNTGDEIKNITGMYILLGFEDGLLVSLKGEMDVEGNVLVYLVKLNTTSSDFVELSSVLIEQDFSKPETASNYVLDNEYLMVNLNSVEGGYSIDLKRFNETDFSNLSYTLRTTNDYEPSIYFKNDLLYLVQFAYNKTLSVNPYLYYAILDFDLNLISEGNYTPNDQGLENYIHYMYDDEIYVLANMFNYNWKILGTINESDEFEVLFPTDYYENEETYTSTPYVSNYNYVTTVKSLINVDNKTVAMVLSAQQTADVKLKAPAEPVDSNFSFDFYNVYQNEDYTKMFSYHFTDSEMRNPIKTVYGDGNYYVLASNRAFEVGIRALVSNNYYLYAIDGEGTLLWEKEFGASNNIDMIYDDGNVIVSSAPQYGDFEIGIISFPTINVTKINGLNGNVIFNTEYSPENIFDNHNIEGSENYEVLMNKINSIQLFSEGYLLLIKNEVDPGITYIVKTDFNGNVLEDKILTQTYEEEVCEGGWENVTISDSLVSIYNLDISGDGSTLLASYSDGSNNRVAKSLDNGTTWTSIISSTSAFYGGVSTDGQTMIFTIPAGFGMGYGDTYLSNNNGTDWVQVGSPFKDVAISGDGATFYFANQTGDTSQLYNCRGDINSCANPINWNLLFNSTEDTSNWQGMCTNPFVKVSKTGATIIMSCSFTCRDMYISNDAGTSWNLFQAPGYGVCSSDVTRNSIAIQDGVGGTNVYLGLGLLNNPSNVFSYNVSSTTWTDLGNFGTTTGSYSVSVSNDANKILVGVNAGRLYLSEDEGTLWEEIMPDYADVNMNWTSSAISDDGSVMFVGRNYNSELKTFVNIGGEVICETIEVEEFLPITLTDSVLIGDSLLISNSYAEDSVNYVINITDFSVIKNITNPSVVQIGRFKRSNGFISSISAPKESINYYRINERDFNFDLLSTLTLGSITVQQFLPTSYGVLLGGYSTHPTLVKETATLSGYYTPKYYDISLTNVSLQNVKIIAGGNNVLINSINGDVNVTGMEITCEDLSCVIEFLGEIGEVYLINNLNVYLSSNLVSFDSDGLNTPVSIRLSKPTGVNIHVLYSSEFCTNVDDCTWEILDGIELICDSTYCTFIAPNGFSSYTLGSETPTQPPTSGTSSSSKDDMNIKIDSPICVGEVYGFKPFDSGSLDYLNFYDYKIYQPLYTGWELVSEGRNKDIIEFTPQIEGVHELKVEKTGYKVFKVTFVVTKCDEQQILSCDSCTLQNYKLVTDYPTCGCECSIKSCPENYQLVDDLKGCRCVYIEPEEEEDTTETEDEKTEQEKIQDELEKERLKEKVELMLFDAERNYDFSKDVEAENKFIEAKSAFREGKYELSEELVVKAVNMLINSLEAAALEDIQIEEEVIEPEEEEENDIIPLLSRVIILLFLFGIWYKFYFIKK